MSRTHLRNAERACALYNRVTCPRTLRTDEQHAICRRAARKVRAWVVARASHVIRENENGRLVLTIF